MTPKHHTIADHNQSTNTKAATTARSTVFHHLSYGQTQQQSPEPQLMNPTDNVESVENSMRRHEDNIKFLNSRSNGLAKSIAELHGSLGRSYSTYVIKENENDSIHTKVETKQILEKENSAAGIFLKVDSLVRPLSSPFAREIVGIVAILAKVESDDISRTLSEYLGLGNMLAIVCNTYEGVKTMEEYDSEGEINYNVGLHGLGQVIGKSINNRFIVICLEQLSPFVGGVIANDPQRKLALPKPRLPNGECPAGFIDFAVNMIHLNPNHLSFLTASGHGLRETLFYALFSRIQIYKTRNEMLNALSCIHDGALSLDGGMIKKHGIFSLGSRNDVEVRFPLISGPHNVPAKYIEAEDMLRKLKWEGTKLAADVQREHQLLNYEKGKSQFKREKLV